MMAYSGATLKPGSGLNISVRNADGSATSISDVTTDDEGNFSLQFDKEGKYLLFATGIIKEDEPELSDDSGLVLGQCSQGDDGCRAPRGGHG